MRLSPHFAKMADTSRRAIPHFRAQGKGGSLYMSGWVWQKVLLCEWIQAISEDLNPHCNLFESDVWELGWGGILAPHLPGRKKHTSVARGGSSSWRHWRMCQHHPLARTHHRRLLRRRCSREKGTDDSDNYVGERCVQECEKERQRQQIPVNC